MTQPLTVNRWLRRIARSRRLSPKAHLVAHTIGLHLNWKTLKAWPAVGTIAAESGLSPRSVQRAVLELKRAGLLWVTYRGKRPSNLSNVYRAVVPEQLDDLDDDDLEEGW